MFSKFDENSQKVLLMAKKEMLDLKHPYVGSEHLLLAILHNSNLEVTKLLNEYNITYDLYRNEIIRVIGIGKSTNDWFLYTPLLKRVLENAIYDAKDNDTEVTVEGLVISLLGEGEGVANRILLGMNVDISLLCDKLSDKFVVHMKNSNEKLLLNEFSINMNSKYMDSGFDPVIGRDDIVNRLIEILLRRTKNNPLLIGDAGVGKTAIVEELVRKIVNGNVPKQLLGKKVYSISMSALVSGTKYRGDFEERINKIISEVENNPDIILFIDEIHTLAGAGGAEGAIDASNILKPSLARGKIKIIGATTNDEYKKYLESDKALDRRFQKVYVNEASLDESKKILLNLKEIYENYHGVIISDKIIDLIIELSNKYVSGGKFPDKAIDILDEACTKTVISVGKGEIECNDKLMRLNNIKKEKNNAIINHDYDLALQLKNKQNLLESELNNLELKKISKPKVKKVTENILYDVVSAKTKIPIKEIMKLNKNSIERYLNSKVYGQNQPINEILSTIYNDKIIRKNSPKCLLLVGKSGVGKTFLVQEYAKLLYQNSAFIKIDMSEYSEDHSISKIIGSPPGYVGYKENSIVLDRVKDNPYSVILLDEIEKGSQRVLRLFLQVLDDGYMTSSTGEKIYFGNTIIFMTSNVGMVGNSIGFKNSKSIVKNKIIDFLGIEFVNRIDALIIFNNITEDVVNKVIRKKLTEFVKNEKLKIKISTDLVEKIKKESNYNQFGLRHVDKAVNCILPNYINISE